MLNLQERLGKEKESVLSVHGGAEVSNSSGGSSSAGPTSIPGSITTPAASSQRRPQTNSTEPDVNGEWLQQLMDMGFSREHCVEALLHTPNVEQATDYLLSNPSSPFASTAQVAVKLSF